MPQLEIRAASASEFETAINWASQQGWNPGLDDLPAFHAADPNGFLMGFMDGQPVSSISVVKYGASFGFLGFYIVHPDFRGAGHGIATWNAGISCLGDRVIGLDGVVDQQDNYRKSGFVYAGRNIRHTGAPQLESLAYSDVEIALVRESDLDALLEFDAAHFPANRAAFTKSWASPSPVRRTSRIAWDGPHICGYGTVRACEQGHKIGPLFATHTEVAEALIKDLIVSQPKLSEVSLDTPEDNPQAVDIALRMGLDPVFETARMYKGEAPDLPLDQIYGITTFELG